MVRCNRIVRVAVLGLVAALLGAACSDSGPDPGPADPEALVRAALPEEAAFAFDVDSTVNSEDADFAEMFPTPNPDATPFPIDIPDDVREHCEFLDPPGAGREPPEGVTTAYTRTFRNVAAAPQPRDDPPATAFVSLAVTVYETKAGAKDAFEASIEEFDSGENLLRTQECLDAMASFTEALSGQRPVFAQREREPAFSVPGVSIWQTKSTSSSGEQMMSALSTVATFRHDYVVASYTANESDNGVIDHEALIRAFVDQVVEADNRR